MHFQLVMSRSQSLLRGSFAVGGGLTAFCLGLVLHTRVGLAQETNLKQSALSLAPADVAFFSTSVNLRDSHEDFMQGDFLRRLRAVPFIQRLEDEILDQWENPQGELEQAKMVIESPNAVNFISLLKDMFSNEVFVYGGSDWCDAIEGMMQLQKDASNIAAQGEEAITEYVMNLDPETLRNVRVPTTVIGFRLSSDAIAREQLDFVEGIVRLTMGNNDAVRPLLANLKRADFAAGQSLTLRLDKSLIPDMNLPEAQQEIFDKVMELLEGRSLSIAVGVKDNILLVAFGEALDLNQFGENPASLFDNQSLAVLVKSTPENLRSISYTSSRWRQSQWDANFGSYFERVASQFDVALQSEAGDNPNMQDWRDEILADAKWMDAKLQEMAPEFGASLAWSHAIDGGLEGIAYDWTKNQNALENATASQLLQFAGSSPLVTIGLKRKDVKQMEEFIEYALQHVPGHLERFIDLAEQDAEEKEMALAAVRGGTPLVRELYEIARDQIGPALADNESVFSIASGWKVDQLPDMPPPTEGLPLPEMALACKLQDRELFLKGCAAIYSVMDRAVDLAREINPDVPEAYRVPRPDEEAVAAGTRYFYSVLSSNVPLDGFEPQLLVGDDAIVVGYTTRQTDEMLKGIAPTNLPVWLRASEPVATVSYVNLAGIIRDIRPWALYGFGISSLNMDAPVVDENGPVPTPNELLQIWDTLEELGEVHGSATVREDGTLVSRWQWTDSNP